MSTFNQVIINGNLGQDPELSHAGGTPVLNLDVATTIRWSGKGGGQQERTEWHRVVVWGKDAESCAKFLKCGSQVLVQGRLQTQSWEDKETGKRCYRTEVRAESIKFEAGYMPSFNQAILLGNLGQDPKLGNANGKPVLNIDVATSDRWTDKEGQPKERVEWHRIVIWGDKAVLAAEHLKKGSQVFVQGKVQTKSWDDKETGKKNYRTEIVADVVNFTMDGALDSDATGRVENPRTEDDGKVAVGGGRAYLS